MENLTFQNEASLPSISVEKRKKSALLPVLIVLFVISYGLMCTLVVEQGSTIEAQRFLIRQLLGDSTQLSAMKGRAFQQKQAEAKAQADANAQSNSQSAEQPKPQVAPQPPTAQPKLNSDNKRSGKMQKRQPKPPQDASEMADERRNLISI